ncbi:MAG: hypothetical protein QF662_04095, partial [Phycisphaerae bacterium]|nr:hypothetical protein [Phycisphaerae bacterium]
VFGLGWGGWPVWESLSKKAREEIVEVMIKEGDHFAKGGIPQTWNYPNSSIEELGLQGFLFSLLANMMPEHPRHDEWERLSRIWNFSQISCPKELAANPRFRDGTRLRDYAGYNPQTVWGYIDRNGGSIHDGGTMMNHWITHHGYASCQLTRFSSLAVYKLAGREPPEGFDTVGVKRTRDFFTRLVKPWGGHIAPDGWNDPYGFFIAPYNFLIYQHATPESWAAWQTTFRRVKALHEKHRDKLAFSFDFWNYSYGRILGPMKEPAEKLTTEQLMTRLSGVHVSPKAKYVLHRSPKSYACFDWHSMSMNSGLLDMDPVVHDKSGDGATTVHLMNAGGQVKWDRLSVQERSRMKVESLDAREDGFSVVLSNNSVNKLRNMMSYTSLPNCHTVLVSRLVAGDDMVVKQLQMGRATFLLDKAGASATGKEGAKEKWPWWDDHKLYLPEGRDMKFSSNEFKPELNPRPVWVNVGNRMGYISIGKSPTIGAGGSAIHFEAFKEDREFGAGEEIGLVVLVSFAGVTADETARLADEVRMLRAAPEGVYAVRIPKVEGLKGTVWVVTNFRAEPVTLALPFEAGGDGKVTVERKSCVLVNQEQ